MTALLLARVTREQAQTKSEQAQTRLEQSKLQALRQAYLAQILGNEKPALALRLGIEAARRERHPEINNILYDLLDRCYEKATYAIGGSPNWVEPRLRAAHRRGGPPPRRLRRRDRRVRSRDRTLAATSYRAGRRKGV